MVDLEYPNGETHSVDKTPKEKDTPSPSEKSSDDMGQSGTTNASDDDQQKCAGEFSSTEERHCNAETCNDVKDQESAAAENPECKEEVSGACGSDEVCLSANFCHFFLFSFFRHKVKDGMV